MRRPKSTEGAFTITGKGVEASSVSLGAAVSKAITIGSRLQREKPTEEDVRSLYVRRLGEDAVARVDIRSDVIEVYSFTPSR